MNGKLQNLTISRSTDVKIPDPVVYEHHTQALAQLSSFARDDKPEGKCVILVSATLLWRLWQIEQDDRLNANALDPKE